MRRIAALILLCAPAVTSAAAPTTLPVPDHVVIVIEENQPDSSISGKTAAPFINSLASGGARLGNFYAITHPSQPNYLALFSGSTQGNTDDNRPTALPFSSPNLGAALQQRGFSFGGYSESMPSVGYDGDVSGGYVRKHNPWVNWQSNTPTANQLAPAVNQPFTNFPTDFSLLPTVSMVVPNLANDMHDGSIAAGDAWLKNNLSSYNTWAKTHNSLLIVTWDEDDGGANNHIATIFSGPMVSPGVVSTRYNTYNLLRTVGDLYGATPPGAAAAASAISGIWKTTPPPPPPVQPPPPKPPTAATRSFRRGTNSYSSSHDTYLTASSPKSTHGSAGPLVAGGTTASQVLIRFDSLFGPGSAQIAKGATITSAKLTLKTANGAVDGSKVRFSAYRMLKAWSESSTWASLTGGITPDGKECSLLADSSVIPGGAGSTVSLDVTKSLQAWAGGASDFGWAILGTGTDAWRTDSNEFSTVSMRPLLDVKCSVPTTSSATGLSAVPEPTSTLGVAFLAIGWLQRCRRRRLL